jgi:hypothetical protein
MAFFQEVVEECQCNICFETKADFVVPNCGHSICNTCCEGIVRVENEDSGRKHKMYKCPICQLRQLTRSNGYSMNRSLNTISEAFEKIPNKCKIHKCFSKTLKCLSCHEFDICAMCFEENHTGHLVVRSEADEEDSMNTFRKTYISSEPPPHQKVHESPPNVKDESSADCVYEKDGRIVTLNGPPVRRGDCVLYMYNSCVDGQWYMGLGLVRRVHKPSDFSQISATDNDDTAEANKIQQNSPLTAAPLSIYSSLRKRKRVRLSLGGAPTLSRAHCPKEEVMLRISRVAPLQAAHPLNSTAPLRPVIETMIDIPLFSVVSNHIHVNRKGGSWKDDLK